jgi:hypothetical protein
MDFSPRVSIRGKNLSAPFLVIAIVCRWSDIIGQPWLYPTPQAQFEGTVGQVNDWLLKRLRYPNIFSNKFVFFKRVVLLT